MELLFLQFINPKADPPRAVFSQQIGVLTALLKADGFGVSLVAMPGYRPDTLKEAIIRRRPQYVLVDLNPYSVTAAHRAISDLHFGYSLPTVVFGSYATCRPTEAISIPGVHALLLGECEKQAMEFFQSIRDGSDPSGTANVWVHADGKLVKGDLAPLVENLDSLPFADRELFYGSSGADADGELQISVCRGCPHWCSHCVNDWHAGLYADKSAFCRRRSVPNVLAEIDSLIARGGVKHLRFLDHAFAADIPWLEEFSRQYTQITRPHYRCHAALENVNDQMARLLRQSLCEQVSTSIPSGSRFIREDIFGMAMNNRQVIDACRTLRDNGLPIRAKVYVGNPYESQITFEETVSLLRECRPDKVNVQVYYPSAATVAAEICRENGWISGRSEDNYWANRSVLDMPSLDAQEIDLLAQKLPAMLKPGLTANIGAFSGKIGKRWKKEQI